MSDDWLNIQYLLDRPIAYHRVFVDVTGSVPSAVFLSQAVYWQKRVPEGRGGWYYKSQAQWKEETGLTRNHIQSARTTLEGLGVMECQLRDFPRRTWYRLNIDQLKEIIVCCRDKKMGKKNRKVDSTNNKLDSTNSQLHSTNNMQNPTYSVLDSTHQFAKNQHADLTETTNNKIKKYNFTYESMPVDNFQPNSQDREHFKNLSLNESFDLIVMEFKLYHRESNTSAMNALAWSKLLCGWMEVRAYGLPVHCPTTGQYGGNDE